MRRWIWGLHNAKRHIKDQPVFNISISPQNQLHININVVCFRAFKQRMKMGRFADQDPEELKKKEEERKLREQKEQDMAGTMKVGDR